MKTLLTIIAIFFAFDIVMVAYILYRRYHKRLPDEAIADIRKRWKKIIAQDDHRHAILDADKLLDYTLGQMGMKGNLGSKLKKSDKLFSSINNVWRAHKVRNNIAHQIDYHVSEKVYKQTMLYFKQAFKDLKIF